VQGAKVDYLLKEAKGGCKSVLHQAAFMGHLPLFQILVSSACCPRASAPAMPALVRAHAQPARPAQARSSRVRTDMACVRVSGCTLLLTKHVRGKVEEGAPALQRDWSVCRDRSRNTPCHHAAVYNRLDIVKWCIENGFDVNMAGDQGYTCLHVAAKHGSCLCVCVLACLRICTCKHTARSSTLKPKPKTLNPKP
jgi:hypothetical protein